MYWAASDVGWVVGHSYIVYGPLLLGATTVLYEGKPVGTPDAGAFWRVAAEHGVKALFTAPTAIRAIRKEDPDGTHLGKYDLSALKYLFLAGERLDPGTYHWASEKLGIPVVDHWWQTETGWAIAANPMGVEALADQAGLADACRCRATTCAFCAPTASAADPARRARSACSCRCRRARCRRCGATTTATSRRICRAFPGYYLTGDGGYFDEDGYLFVMGRIDDVINVAGHRLVDRFDRGGARRPSRRRGVRGDRCRRRDQGAGAARPRRAQGRRDRPRTALPKSWSPPSGTTSARSRAFKLVDVVPALPKTRSGKILRKTMRGIADGRDEPVPSTIEDPAVLETLKPILRS